MRVQFGSGYDRLEGFINCDISEECNPDVVCDLNKRLPFKDNSIKEIVLNHILEHTHEPIKVMGELYRICKDNAIVRIRVPYFSSESAFSMIDHYSFYSFTTFDCLDRDHPSHWQGVGDFKTVSKKLTWRKPFKIFEWIFGVHPKITRIYQEIFCWIFPAKELNIILEVRK
jgi:predicted SAM-dependent methyltransferase